MGVVFMGGGRVGMTKPGSRLPKGYTELAYIEATGTQYINTGFNPNQDTRVVCDVLFQVPAEYSSNYLFGCRTSSSQNKFAINGYNGRYESHYNNNTLYLQDSLSIRFVLDKNKNVTVSNGETYTQTYANFTCPGSLYLFAMNNNGSVYSNASARLYACQIYDNGTLVRDFVPCVSDAYGIGLYDMVNGKFYANAGSGTFIGSEVA